MWRCPKIDKYRVWLCCRTIYSVWLFTCAQSSSIIFSFYCLLSIFASSLSVVNQVIFVHKSTLGCTMSYMAGYLDTLDLFAVLYSCSWKRNVNSHEVYFLFVFACVSWCKLFSEPHYFSLRVLLVLYLQPGNGAFTMFTMEWKGELFCCIPASPHCIGAAESTGWTFYCAGRLPLVPY